MVYQEKFNRFLTTGLVWPVLKETKVVFFISSGSSKNFPVLSSLVFSILSYQIMSNPFKSCSNPFEFCQILQNLVKSCQIVSILSKHLKYCQILLNPVKSSHILLNPVNHVKSYRKIELFSRLGMKSLFSLVRSTRYTLCTVSAPA